MELGLSLGDHHPSKTPFGFIDRTPQVNNKGSPFCMALSIATPNPKPSQDQEQQELLDDPNKTSAATSRKRSATVALIDADSSSRLDPPTPLPLQLDLLPNTPVPRNHRHSFPWSTFDNGMSQYLMTSQTHLFCFFSIFPLSI